MSAHNLQNLPHSDVLEKLKMQVRDMKVGLMDPDFPLHAAAVAGYGGAGFGTAQNLTHGGNTNGFVFQSPNATNKDGKQRLVSFSI